MKTEKFPRIVVMIDNFSHDTNGNPTALHTVYGYRTQDAAVNSPSAKLHEAKRRKQVGYGNNMDCNAGDAIEKSGLSLADYDLIRKEGDRSEGFINLVYNLKTADKPEQTQAEKELTKKYIESEFLAVCPFTTYSDKNGQIRMQLQSEKGKTKFLNVSPEQFRAIEKIMLGE